MCGGQKVRSSSVIVLVSSVDKTSVLGSWRNCCTRDWPSGCLDICSGTRSNSFDLRLNLELVYWIVQSQTPTCMNINVTFNDTRLDNIEKDIKNIMATQK